MKRRLSTRVLVVDNYDSFTYNLVQYLGELGAEPLVLRNDEVSPGAAAKVGARRLVISPGPGRPEDAGYSIACVRELGPTVPTLGVCLGHQVVAAAFGGRVGRAPRPMHGKTSVISHDGGGVFTGLPPSITATRYHSLAVLEPLPAQLMATAHSDDGVIQAIRHREHPIAGVQFHPESVLTAEGKQLLRNFLEG